MGRGPFSLFRHGVLIWLECFSVMVHCNSWRVSVRTGHFCTSTTAESGVRIWCRWGAFRPPVALAAVRSWAVALLLLICCWLLLLLWDSVVVLCFVVRCFVSLLVLRSFWWGGGGSLLCLVCLPGVLWLLCGSSSWCSGFVCSL